MRCQPPGQEVIDTKTLFYFFYFSNTDTLQSFILYYQIYRGGKKSLTSCHYVIINREK